MVPCSHADDRPAVGDIVQRQTSACSLRLNTLHRLLYTSQHQTLL